jgi:Spy/CpxP family protein refolding chaperone
MKRVPLALLLAAALSTASQAEAPSGGDTEGFGRYLFPPDLVMGHAQEIGLDDAQRKALRAEVQKAQSKFLDLQFEMQEEQEKMTRLVQEKPVDEGKALAEVDRILALEKEVKKTQVGLLVRIKNLLTSAQQAKLTELRKGDAK